MSLFNRRRMMAYIAAAKKAGKPIYLPYLESVGQQWIDTGIYGHQGMAISVTGTFLSKNGFLYGSRKAGRDILLSKDDDNGGWAGVGLNSKYTADLRVGVKNEFVMIDGKFVYINGVKNVALPKTQEYQSQAPIALFALATDVGVAQRGSAIRIYSFQAHDANGMIVNLRPCLHPETFRPAMYDTVSGKYFYNQGSGEFKYDLSFVGLDYIESNGGQYIDTGFKPNPKRTRMELCFENTGYPLEWIAFLGARDEPELNEKSCAILAGMNKVYRLDWRGIPDQVPMEIGVKQKMVCFDTAVTIDDYTYVSQKTKPDIRLNSSLYICNGNSVGKPFKPEGVHQKVFSSRIDEGGILKRDMIPCRMNNGEIGMWDFIGGNFYGNSGTGKFSGGIGDYTIGSYVMFDGKSYIDTGFHISRDMQAKTYLSNSAKETHASYWVYGARAGDGVGILFNPREYYAMFGGVSQPYADTTIYDAYVKGSPFTITMREGFLACNDTQLKIGSWVGFPNQDLPMTLGTIVDKNGMIDARMYKGDVRTHIFIDSKACVYLVPAKKSDGTIGMLDVISGKMHTNAGTGSFGFVA